MTLAIGPWTLRGTDAQNAILKPMYERMAAILKLPDGSYRVKSANVYVRERDKMPWAKKPSTKPDGTVVPGIRATGYWTGTNQLIAADQFDDAVRVRKIGAHETAHQLDDQWMEFLHRKEIKPLFDPVPASFPGEEFAVYGSAAIFGFTNPPYKNFYDDYVIPVADWPKVKEAALADHRPPVDPCADLKLQVEQLTQQVQGLTDDLNACNAGATACQEQAADLTQQLEDEKAAHALTAASLAECSDDLKAAKENAQETVDL